MAERRRIGRRIAGAALIAVPWVGLAVLLAHRHAAPAVVDLGPPEAPPEPAYEILEPGRGRMAATPLDIPPAGWADILWRTWREIAADRLTAVAGGVTFYVLLAVFPALGVFAALYGLFGDVADAPRLLAGFAAVVPRAALELLELQMARLASGPPATLSLAFVVSLLLSVWSAKAGMRSLFEGLNVAYGETERRGWAARTALTYGFTLAALVLTTLLTVVLVTTPLLLRRSGLGVLAPFWDPLSWIGLFVVASGAFAALYRYGPSRAHARWRWVRIGGAAAALGWLIGSLGLSWYLDNIAHFDATYGSLGAAVGCMLWIWFSVLAILAGAELNAETEHQTTVDTTTGPPQPMGQRGAVMADTVGVAFKTDAEALLIKGWRQGEAGARRLRAALRRRQLNSSSRAESRAA
ncbi:YihY/virulence factor BrkB family protein [Phenylobacterium aquaticum]|uniref:YihY/virulence factor BrkB family protein n=1 Tax=Phenylobacterium aquaticum TaxID=1763816 RepID=UPI001F5C55AB|nr:YihY/virulence factor BrkB family protein [Phenylobacterium aquaticum]